MFKVNKDRPKVKIESNSEVILKGALIGDDGKLWSVRVILSTGSSCFETETVEETLIRAIQLVAKEAFNLVQNKLNVPEEKIDKSVIKHIVLGKTEVIYKTNKENRETADCNDKNGLEAIHTNMSKLAERFFESPQRMGSDETLSENGCPDEDGNSAVHHQADIEEDNDECFAEEESIHSVHSGIRNQFIMTATAEEDDSSDIEEGPTAPTGSRAAEKAAKLKESKQEDTRTIRFAKKTKPKNDGNVVLEGDHKTEEKTRGLDPVPNPSVMLSLARSNEQPE